MSVVAAFDFDGTICRGDAVIPFLVRLRGFRRVAIALVAISPLLRTRNRDVLKRAMTKRLVSGVPEFELNKVGAQFADDLLATKTFTNVLDALRHHQQQGHRVIIVSASYDSYLKHVADKLGCELISTRIEVADGYATGALVDSTNVRAAQKPALLQQTMGPQDELYAYGNSSGDVPMLTIAAHPFMVGRNGDIKAWSPLPAVPMVLVVGAPHDEASEPYNSHDYSGPPDDVSDKTHPT